MSEKKRVMKESEYGRYYTVPYSRSRGVVEDFIAIGKKSMKVHAIGEMDVTYILQKIKDYKTKGIKLSFSAYLMYVLSRTVAEHPYIQAIRLGRRKMVIFEDVDVMFIVEREVAGKKMPTGVTIRKANEKSLLKLTDILWSAKKIKDNRMIDKKKEGASSTDKLLRLPRFLSRALMNRIFKNPFQRRKFSGTIGITSVGMFAKGGGAALPIAVENFSICVGGIDRRPGYALREDGTQDYDKIVPRDYLTITFNIDHTTVDGGPIARFIAIFRERLRDGYGLDDLESSK